jgi:hypothetical protein
MRLPIQRPVHRSDFAAIDSFDGCERVKKSQISHFQIEQRTGSTVQGQQLKVNEQNMPTLKDALNIIFAFQNARRTLGSLGKLPRCHIRHILYCANLIFF